MMSNDHTQSLLVHTSTHEYHVHVGSHLLDTLSHEIYVHVQPDASVCIISDTTVFELWGSQILEGLRSQGHQLVEPLLVPAGESSKQIATLSDLLEGLADRTMGRHDLIIALGGGVVGDIAGLAAALYMRGCKVIQVPTTLLAMVDSSVGGKTAIDLRAGKNLAGVFWPPHAVIADTCHLSTLPHEEWVNGSAEIIKHAILADPELFASLESHPFLLFEEAPEEAAELIARNIAIKQSYVEADEREGYLRQSLNLGHTFGHVFEALSNFSLPHGKAVGLGLALIADISYTRGLCSSHTRDAIYAVLKSHELIEPYVLDLASIFSLIKHDKKKSNQGITLISIQAIGECFLETLTFEELEALVHKTLDFLKEDCCVHEEMLWISR